MGIDRDDADERTARIDQILEELRLNTEDLHELAKGARERGVRQRSDAATQSSDAKHRTERLKQLNRK